ncbi:carbohydrate porin [Robbsia andropogonis]|uniref:carbohydrate porin n=1 Tax=Robbsia andropogonis TaxID=28092 RepID=UPI00209F330D|nr:carbohydrate porin [Robbsia andropogonis]MCP1120373.1 carbohydrate porin [Robbsia andropogonis]MCP1130273.1 carbohydrate porin [Robbsia andropogonis]
MKFVNNVLATKVLLLAAVTANAQSNALTQGGDASTSDPATRATQLVKTPAAPVAAASATGVANGHGGTTAQGTQYAQNVVTPDTTPNIGMPLPSGGHGDAPGLRQGPLAGFGDWLGKYGVDLGLLLTNGYFNNPSTGVSPGKSANYGSLFMSATIDLDKLIGIPDTQINFVEAWNRPAHNTKTYLFQTGSAFTAFPVQSESSDLVKFTLSHDLFDKRLHIEYGRMNTNDNFMVPTMCSGCVVSTPAITLDAPGVTKSVWGARVAWQLTQYTKLGLGVIEDNSDNWTTTSGWNWTTRTRAGLIGIANVTHDTDFKDSRFPTKYEVGVYHKTTPYTDSLYNTDGTSQALNPTGTPLKHTSGTWGFYGQGRKVFWRDSDSKGPVPRNLAAYGGAFITPGPGQAYPIEAYSGIEYGGFLKNNSVALVGTTVRYIRLSSERALYEQQARYAFTSMLNGATGGAVPVVNNSVARNTFTFDVHAQFGIVPGMLVQGFAQYFLHPNTAVLASVSQAQTRSGWMVGAFLVIDIGRLTGLSKM